MGGMDCWKNSAIQKTKVTLIFSVFNIALPLADIVTDILTAKDLRERNHIYWSFLTLFWMFLPFFFTFLFTTLNMCKKKNGKKSDLVKLILHFPFVLPLTNTLLAIRLAAIDLTNPSNAREIESIKKTSSLAGLYESFLESGPQLLTQIHIFMCTGHFTNIQIISSIISILTLTLAACKAFYVQRQFSEADPDPNAHMIIIIFFGMLVNIINGSAQWTVIAGLTKHFIVIPIFFVALITWISLRRYKKVLKNQSTKKEEPGKDYDMNQMKETKNGDEISSNDELEPLTKVECGNNDETDQQQDNQSTGSDEEGICEISKNCCLFCCLVCFCCLFACYCYKGKLIKKLKDVTGKLPGKVFRVTGRLAKVTLKVTGRLAKVTLKVIEDKEDDKGYFFLKSALTSVWVTCVVGRHPQTFLISSLTSLATRTVFLIGAIIFSFLDFYPAFLQERAFLLHCSSNETLGMLNIQPNKLCSPLASCFDQNDTNLLEFHRICGEDEMSVNISILVTLIALIILNLLSTYFLHRLSDYLTLYDVSKRSPLQTIVHRNILFQLIKNEGHFKLEEVVKILQIKADSEIDNQSHLNIKELSMLDRQNANGESPLNVAVKLKSNKSVVILCEAGAQVITDSSNHHPVSIAAENNDITCLTTLLKFSTKDSILNVCKQLIESDKIALVKLMLDHHLNQYPILYMSKIFLGNYYGAYSVEQNFDFSGDGKKEMKSLTINLNKDNYPVGLEVVWTDGSRDTAGRLKGHEQVKRSKVLVPPKGGYFSFIRGRSEDVIYALVVDSVNSKGNIKRGQWVGATGNVTEESHTASYLDNEDSPVTSRLYGLRGQIVNDFSLKNLCVTYRIASKDTE